MSPSLVFPDAPTAADVATFASRAVRLGDGAVRLQARQGTLVLTSAPLAPKGLLDPTPTVLGLRATVIDPELECDLVVEAAALLVDPQNASSVRLPDTALAPAWAGVAPPRTGWVQASAIPAATLASRAQWGIAAVSDALPSGAGDDAVRAVRASVWGAPDAALGDLPLGVAFAAFALGFIGGDERAVVRTSGPWTRLSLARGHVIVRGPAVSGMTPVRRTGGLA